MSMRARAAAWAKTAAGAGGGAAAASAMPAVVDEDWQRPAPSPEQLRQDRIGALLLLIGSGLSAYLYGIINLFEREVNAVWTAVCVILIIAPLALRRRYPITVAFLVSVMFVVMPSTDVQEFLFSNIALFVAIYTVGAWSRNRQIAAVVRIAIIAAMLLWLVIGIVWQSTAEVLTSESGSVSAAVAIAGINIVINLLYFAGAYYFGDAMYRAAKLRAQLSAQAADLQLQQQRATEQAVAMERMRIARELHDVVAHHVSLMGVQASAAGRLIAADRGADASAALGSIEHSARSTVEELHGLLHALRDSNGEEDSGAASAAASTLGIEQLPLLVAECRRAGQQLEFQLVGEPYPLPATHELVVYRVVQEALANARRHAGHAVADVRLRFLPEQLEVVIADEGHGTATAGRPSTAGLGLRGMRERVEAVGGALEYGPKPAGGWRVRAVFPVPPEQRAAKAGELRAAGAGPQRQGSGG